MSEGVFKINFWLLRRDPLDIAKIIRNYFAALITGFQSKKKDFETETTPPEILSHVPANSYTFISCY